MDKAADQALRAGRDHPPSARLRRPRRERAADRELSKMVEEASALALIGAKEHGVRGAASRSIRRSTWCWPTRCRCSR